MSRLHRSCSIGCTQIERPLCPHVNLYRNTAPPATLRSILDLVSKVLLDATEEAQWQPAGIKHKADYRAPKLSHVGMTDGHRTMSSYDIDGPSPALSSDPVYLFDKRPGIKRNRLASLDELLRIQDLPPSAVAGLSLSTTLVYSSAEARSTRACSPLALP